MKATVARLRRQVLALPSVRASLLVIGALGLYLRSGIADHFTHVDDIGVAYSLVTSDERLGVAQLRLQLDSLEHQPTLGRQVLKAIQHTPLFVPAAVSASFVATAMRIPRAWTYAPLQFFATELGMRIASDYESRLFWGRAPSWLASVAAIVAMAVLAAMVFAGLPGAPALAVLCLAIVALSAEQVVYAKQMESYAIGVLSIIVLMIVLARETERETPRAGWRSAAGLVLILALLGHAQYQLLFALPAFYVAWWMDRRSVLPARQAIVYPVLCGVVMSALFVPIYLQYLRWATSLGMNGWNVGPNREFAFESPPGFASLGYFARFFLRNGYLTLESQVSPVPDWHPAYRALGIPLALLAVIGFVALVTSKHRARQAIGRFIAALGGTWVMLVVLHRLTLSPTRHSMILLPVFAICVAAGVATLGRFWAVAPQRLSVSIAWALACSAILSLPRARTERQRPIRESSLRQVLDDRRVSVLYTYDCTLDAVLMPTVRFSHHLFQEVCGVPAGTWYGPVPRDADRIAFLSTRTPFSDAIYERARRSVFENAESAASHLSLPPRSEMVESYRVARRSDVEIEISRLTRNGTNSFHLVILERRAASRR